MKCIQDENISFIINIKQDNKNDDKFTQILFIVEYRIYKIIAVLFINKNII